MSDSSLRRRTWQHQKLTLHQIKRKKKKKKTQMNFKLELLAQNYKVCVTG